MSRSWWFRFGFLVFFFVIAVIYVIPTIANLDLEKTKFPYKKKVNLGLDLQGGLYMVYGVDFNKMYKEVLERNVDTLRNDLEKEGASTKAGKLSQEFPDDPSLSISVPADKKDVIRAKMKKQYNTLRIVEDKADELVLGISRDFRADLNDKTLNQSVQVIRNRIDEFGVSEPSITTRGQDRVVVELPGVKDVERAKALVGRTARLEFKIVADELMNQAQVMELVAKIEKDNNIVYKEGQNFSEYTQKINTAAAGKIPENTEIKFERQGAERRLPYLLHSKIEITGNELQDANVGLDPQSGGALVSFQMNPRGAVQFGEVTERNLHKRMAIILDEVVHSAPQIQSKIGEGRGQITLGRGGNQQDIMKEAKDLSIVLRAGALPAQLELLEQRVIGPSLGADSIKQGIMAGTVGCIAIFLFMLFYYRMSGAVATFSLLLNGLFVFAILIGIDATLTLPGIAGLALTIGMAVDSNVIIFERIRDELLEGRTVASAVQAGFDKAFACIFDANITHGIVAIILLNFGSGPIKGFAVTLLIGIITTLFCAVTVCKLIFDWYLASQKQDLKKLSI